MKGLASVSALASPASSEAKHYRDIVSSVQDLIVRQRSERGASAQIAKLKVNLVAQARHRYLAVRLVLRPWEMYLSEALVVLPAFQLLPV